MVRRTDDVRENDAATMDGREGVGRAGRLVLMLLPPPPNGEDDLSKSTFTKKLDVRRRRANERADDDVRRPSVRWGQRWGFRAPLAHTAPPNARRPPLRASGVVGDGRPRSSMRRHADAFARRNEISEESKSDVVTWPRFRKPKGR